MSHSPSASRSFASERERFLSTSDRWFRAVKNPRTLIAPEFDEDGRRLIRPINLGASDVDLATVDAFIEQKAESTRDVLHVPMGLGALTVRDTRALEFGPGNGGSTIALRQMLANIVAAGAQVSLEAIEINPDLVEDIVDLGILSAADLHVGDGFSFMGDPQNAGRYDLVFASWPGPFYDDTKGGHFVQAAQSALSPRGRLILSTDPRTFGHIVAGCEATGTPHIVVHGMEVGAAPTENILIAQKIPELV